MITEIYDYYKKNQWEILILASIILFLMLYFYQLFFGKKNSGRFIGLTKNYYRPEVIKRYYKPEVIKKKVKCLKKHEAECRRILEKIYNKPFPSIRPNILRNPETGRNLELDCFNYDLMLGIEMNGCQHTKYTPFFHKTYDNFLSQIRRDRTKKELCEKYNIDLINVPHTIKFNDLESYLVKELKKINKL